MLDARTYPDKSVIKFVGQLVPLKINSDKDAAIADRYGVVGQPTILFLDYNGKVLGQFVGFHLPKDFISEATKILRKRTRK